MDAADGEDDSYSSPSPPPRRSFAEMILDAIGALEDDKISNESAILGYIKGKYGARLPRKHVSLVRSNLARMVCTGEIVLNLHNNYCRPPDPPPVILANAAVPAVEPRRRWRRRKRRGPAPEPTFVGAVITLSEGFVLGTIDADAPNTSSHTFPLSFLPPYPEMIVEGKYGARLKPRHAMHVRAHLSLMKARGTVLSVAPTPPQGEGDQASSGR